MFFRVKKRFLFATLFITGLLLIVYSWQVEPNLLQVKKLQLQHAAIKKEATLLFLSDLHLPLRKLLKKKLFTQIKAFHPDYILIGGDFSSHTTEASQALTALGEFARYAPVIIVPGNTDVCERQRRCLYCTFRYPENRLTKIPALLLRNQEVVLSPYGIAIYGLDDPTTNYDDTNLIALVPDSLFSLLLVHNNYRLTNNQIARFDCILSGHTHGGQIAPARPLIRLLDKNLNGSFMQGCRRVGKTTMVVSSGIGMSVLPVRCGVIPQVWAIHIEPLPSLQGGVDE